MKVHFNYDFGKAPLFSWPHSVLGYCNSRKKLTYITNILVKILYISKPKQNFIEHFSIELQKEGVRKITHCLCCFQNNNNNVLYSKSSPNATDHLLYYMYQMPT